MQHLVNYPHEQRATAASLGAYAWPTQPWLVTLGSYPRTKLNANDGVR